MKKEIVVNLNSGEVILVHGEPPVLDPSESSLIIYSADSDSYLTFNWNSVAFFVVQEASDDGS